jgi:ketosteroid isomerase-like protein
MLKNLFTTLAFCFMLTIHLTGQSIEAQVEILRQNMLNPNISALNLILSPDLVYGHSNGHLEDKGTFIDNLTNGNYDFTEISCTDQSIKLSKHIAVVRHTLRAKTNDKGIPAEINLKILLVWKKEGKNWQLWERQSAKIVPH